MIRTGLESFEDFCRIVQYIVKETDFDSEYLSEQ